MQGTKSGIYLMKQEIIKKMNQVNQFAAICKEPNLVGNGTCRLISECMK